MALRKPEYTPILSPAPREYVHYQQWPEYAPQMHYGPAFQPKIIFGNPRGFRRGLWPLYVEEYIGDDEPMLEYKDPGAPPRFVLWRRISRTDKPAGWMQSYSHPAAMESFIELRPGEDYWASWSKIARNERRRWLELQGKKYTIEPVSWEEFRKVFKKSSVKKKIGTWYIDMFKQKSELNPGCYCVFGVRALETGELVAAMGYVNSPTYNSSFYDIGCKIPSVKDPVMVGLIDHWFARCRAQGIRYLQMGGVWIPGKPRDWKGFSAFKAKFRPGYIALPPLLWKFKRGKLF